MLDLGLDLQACVSCVAVWHHWHQNDVLVQYLAICPLVLQLLQVRSILIGVRTLILVLSEVCILASVWNMVVWVTGHHGFQ